MVENCNENAQYSCDNEHAPPDGIEASQGKAVVAKTQSVEVNQASFESDSAQYHGGMAAKSQLRYSFGIVNGDEGGDEVKK